MLRPRKSPTPATAPAALTWPPATHLISLQLTLHPSQRCTLPSNYTYWLHAWFLDQIRQVDPTVSAALHDNQTEKAFTLAGLLGEVQTQATDRTVTFNPATPYHLHISAFTPALCTALQQWLHQPPSHLALHSDRFSITDWQIAHPATTYEALWDAPPLPELSLTFLSPTSFRKYGNHMPLPIPENLFHSYLRRWNLFAHLEFESEDFLEWVNEFVILLRHDIRSHKAQPGKQGSVTGFVGSIQLGLSPKAQEEPEYVQLIHALIRAAPYFGTGHKTTFGLGQTQLGWLPTPSELPIALSIPPAEVPKTADRPTTIPQLRKTLIKDRIAELEPQFLAAKKRQGGDRARKTAHLWATIIARQEIGDSLKAIAADLKLPYDTVKKYAQIARKQLTES